MKAVLCECAWAAARSRNTRLSATYWRWVKRMGKKKALVALAHLILKIAYNILSNKTLYQEFGTSYLVDQEKLRERKLIRLLESKGYKISTA